jgi:hypothetical protein
MIFGKTKLNFTQNHKAHSEKVDKAKNPKYRVTELNLENQAFSIRKLNYQRKKTIQLYLMKFQAV